MSKAKLNNIALSIWIAENGGPKAKEDICTSAKISSATLSRLLSEKPPFPRFDTRYLIWKKTGVTLWSKDNFSSLRVG